MSELHYQHHNPRSAHCKTTRHLYQILAGALCENGGCSSIVFSREGPLTLGLPIDNSRRRAQLPGHLIDLSVANTCLYNKAVTGWGAPFHGVPTDCLMITVEPAAPPPTQPKSSGWTTTDELKA